MVNTRTSIDPPATADGVNCNHCCAPLAATAFIDHGCSRSYVWVHADTGKRACATVAWAEPRSGWEAGLRIDAVLTRRTEGA
jgi:hypothetical protein